MSHKISLYTKQNALLLDGVYKGGNFITTPTLVRKKLLFDLYDVSMGTYLQIKKEQFQNMFKGRRALTT